MSDRHSSISQGSDTGAVRDPDGEGSTIARDSRFLERAQDELEKAVDARDASTKNYHIRSALQAIVILDENRSP